MLEYETLKLIWLLFIGVLFIGFAVSGGSDLGVGALLVVLGKNDKERHQILNSIGPTWEGNQVWFVTAAGAIFAAWPLMYAAAFSSFYLVLLLVLVALILRPPGMDYRSKLPSKVWRTLWDYGLFLSGFIPIFIFGVAFGNLFYGIPFQYDDTMLPHISQSFFGYLNAYSLLLGVVSASLLLLQAALFLQLKTTDIIHERAKKIARRFGFLFIISFSVAWYWTVYKVDGLEILSMPNPNQSFTPLAKIVKKGLGYWLHNYEHYSLGYVAPILAIVCVIKALCFSGKKYPGTALFFNSVALASVIVTAGFTLFPFIFPSSSFPNHSLTIWDAASSCLTLAWMLAATLLFLPIVLCYTTWVYRVMRGPVKLSVRLQHATHDTSDNSEGY